MNIPSHLNVLSIGGSLRSGSYNRALLRAIQELAPPDITLRHFDLSAIPPYNGDVEAQGDPDSVVAFKEAIRSADALLIATPEYNYGIPGVLKNAIDWASRPPGKTPLAGKPAAIVGASMGAGGTIRAQLSLRQTFLFTETYAMLKPEVLIAKAHEKFDAEGKLMDEPTRQHLGKFLSAFQVWIRLFKANP